MARTDFVFILFRSESVYKQWRTCSACHLVAKSFYSLLAQILIDVEMPKCETWTDRKKKSFIINDWGSSEHMPNIKFNDLCQFL